MRAFVYCRVSTRKQATDDHYSLANQEARCRDYIRHCSWQLAKVLRDVGSGKSVERPNYQELLLAIREKRVDVVVVYRLDRLSRNVVDVYGALDAFSRSDVAFVSVQESLDTTTAMGRAMLGGAAVFAQLTREMISENTKDGLARRAQAGKWTGGPRSRPYGYQYAAGELHLVPEEAEVVRRIFRLYAEHGWGLTKIAQLLNAEGTLTATGLTGRWSVVVLGKILRNPVYAGRIRSGTQDFPGEHEAILNPELFQAAADLIGQRSDMGPRGKSSPHLLSGIARCGQCQRNRSIHHTRSKDGAAPYLSYRHKNLATGAQCLHIQKSGRRLEELVVEQVRQLAGTKRLRESALAVARAELRGKAKPLADERAGITRKLSEGEAAFDKWVAVKTLFIEPSSPWENGYCESFNSKLRDELLNPERFDRLLEAQVLVERWRRYYNQVRPHRAPGYRPPAPAAWMIGEPQRGLGLCGAQAISRQSGASVGLQ